MPSINKEEFLSRVKELDEEGEEYLLRLWEKFGLPVEYKHIRTGL